MICLLITNMANNVIVDHKNKIHKKIRSHRRKINSKKVELFFTNFIFKNILPVLGKIYLIRIAIKINF